MNLQHESLNFSISDDAVVSVLGGHELINDVSLFISETIYL